MNLSSLKEAIDSAIEHLPNHESPDNILVLITLSESSMGARASTGIYHAAMGFDWEHGQFRLAPNKELVSKGNSLTDVKEVVCRQFRGRNFYFCPRCESKITKNDCFCRDCSQKLK